MPTYAKIVEQLRSAGCVFAEDEAILIVDAAASDGDLAALVARRVSGEPLEQVVGWAQFGGLRITIDRGVFVPRRRTELLARRAASVSPPKGVVVDLCCGSGAVGALVRAIVPGVDLHATDQDAAAVACARRNLGDQVYQGDLYAALPERLRGQVDVLVANAPYVPTAEIALMPPEARGFEPPASLDGGQDGLEVVRRVVFGAREWIKPDGHVLFEVGKPQVDAATALCHEAGLVPLVVREEDLGATVVLARRG